MQQRYTVIVILTLTLTHDTFINLFTKNLVLVSGSKEAQADEIDYKIIEEFKSENIRDFAREFSSQAHMAGTPRQKDTAEMIFDLWIEHKLDTVNIVNYDVLLNYPDTNKNNKVSLINENGGTVWESSGMEIPLLDEENSNIVQPFNAFSANGNVTNDLVYVNYGTYEDFNYIVNVLGQSIEGKIGIVRYGKIFRGTKAQNAQIFNLSALILYTDPSDYAKEGVEDDEVFPHSWWLPRHGVQRGSISVVNGDLLTIDYPANAYMYREIPKKGLFPWIPVFPIGYGDAAYLLCGLLDLKIPPKWQNYFNCSLFSIDRSFYQNIPFKLKTRVEVNHKNERRPIYNVIGRINGSTEPDRYVILGNHRDSWTLGASDPVSGTACLLEMTRVFGHLLQQGWRPRRTIIFASWDAEEYSLVGSVEYVEDNLKQLRERAVAYLNVDTAVAGNATLFIKSSPLLAKVAYDVAKLVPNPNKNEIGKGRLTLYDTWLKYSPKTDSRNDPLPKIDQLGSGSDFVPFQYFAGVSSMDIKYYFDKKKFKVSNYPLYHTRYDTFYNVINFIDPDFTFHRSTGQFWALAGRYLADALILPFSPANYGVSLLQQLEEILQTYDRSFLHKYGICADDLKEAVLYLSQKSQEFEKKIFFMERRDSTTGLNESSSMTDLEARILNDKLMMFERGFIDTNGLPTKPRYKHMVLAPTSEDYYTGSSFPALSELLQALKQYTSTKAGSSGPNPLIPTLLALTQCAHFSTLNSPVLAEPNLYYQTFATSDHQNHDYLISYSTRDICAFNDTINYILKPFMDVGPKSINITDKEITMNLIKKDVKDVIDDPTHEYLNNIQGMKTYYKNGKNKQHSITLITEAIKKHIAVLSFAIRTATSFMEN